MNEETAKRIATAIENLENFDPDIGYYLEKIARSLDAIDDKLADIRDNMR